MYGDSRFDFYSAGSNATATSGVEGFFGAYSGLSLLHNEEVVHLQISASVNEFFLGPLGRVASDSGYKVYPGLSIIDLPPMRVGTASLLEINRAVGLGETASDFNASFNYVIWRRSDLH